MIWALLAVSVVALVSLTLICLVAFRQIETRTDRACAVEYEVRNLLTARVTTLENRLQSGSLQEFAHAQEASDELDKVRRFSTNGWGEERPEEAYGETREDMVEAAMASQGIDLEGPTIG